MSTSSHSSSSIESSNSSAGRVNEIRAYLTVVPTDSSNNRDTQQDPSPKKLKKWEKDYENIAKYYAWQLRQAVKNNSWGGSITIKDLGLCEGPGGVIYKGGLPIAQLAFKLYML